MHRRLFLGGMAGAGALGAPPLWPRAAPPRLSFSRRPRMSQA